MYVYIYIYIYVYIYMYTAYTMSHCRQGLEGLPASPDLPPVAAPLDRRAPRDGHGARWLRGLGRWRQRGGDGGGGLPRGKAMGEAMGKKKTPGSAWKMWRKPIKKGFSMGLTRFWGYFWVQWSLMGLVGLSNDGICYHKCNVKVHCFQTNSLLVTLW